MGIGPSTWQCSPKWLPTHEVKFRIYKESASGEQILLPKLSIKPSIMTPDGQSPHADIPEENKKEFPAIMTSQADFCSDSCGIVTFKFRPWCWGSGSSNFVVTSGSAKAAEYEIKFEEL